MLQIQRMFACVTMAIVNTAVLAAAPMPTAVIVKTFGDWTFYASDDGTSAGKVCFLVAQPTMTEPPGLTRDPALAYVSAWPKDGVKSEISFKIGFVVKKPSDPTATVIGPSASSYKLFVKDDRAYVADPTQELKLLEALKKGSKLTVQALSDRGTTTTDSYSLQGITAALQALAGSCP